MNCGAGHSNSAAALAVAADNETDTNVLVIVGPRKTLMDYRAPAPVIDFSKDIAYPSFKSSSFFQVY